MNTKEKSVLDLIDRISGAPKYQTVELDGKVIRQGTEQCPLTWENILKLGVSFKDKTIFDLGSFNGYFSFKAMKLGAKKVLGIDNNGPAIQIYNHICDLYNYEQCHATNKNLLDCNFFAEKSDITLCLNVLHHVKKIDSIRYKNVLKYIFDNSENIIAEINETELSDFIEASRQSKLKLVNKIRSHRNTMFGQRYVIHYN